MNGRELLHTVAGGQSVLVLIDREAETEATRRPFR